MSITAPTGMTINTGKAEVTLTEVGHIKVRVHEDADLFEKDIKAINQAQKEFVKGQPYTVLVVSPDSGNISPEAREFSASPEANTNAIAKAIVARSLLSRLAGRFYILFNSPAAPTELFSSEEEAMAWLQKMRQAA